MVEYPAWISTEAKDIISQLLDRNPKTRLGCRGRGVSELRNHAWFASIDWQALSDLQLDPPIRPSSTQVISSLGFFNFYYSDNNPGLLSKGERKGRF